MKQSDKPEKILLKAIHVYWRLYYLILLSRILLPTPFLIIFFFESRGYESKIFWGVLVFFFLAQLILAIIARPYYVIGKLVISESRVYFDGELAEFDNCDKIEICVSKPTNNPFLHVFSFYQFGFGSWIKIPSNKRTQHKVSFSLETKQEFNELKSFLDRIEQTNNLNLEIVEFKQPAFPNWNSFEKKKNE